MTFEEWFLKLEEWPYSETALASHAWDARVPEGYVIVPEEPTEKVIDAFWKVVEEDKEARISNVYRAMIQAAQEEA